jgi:uncharacterized membrane protein
MSKQVLNELRHLMQAQVINEETAKRIADYYKNQPTQSSNRLFIVFSILGSLLIGLGIVLILAHNWDNLSKGVKLTVGLLPLLVAQALAGYVVAKKNSQTAWREGSGVFLFFAIAISISIVSQVYNIEGDLAGFLLTWMCLALPVIYVLRSSFASLLFIAGITWYGCEAGYFSYPNTNAEAYWILFLLILPFYYFELLRRNLRNNFFHFHSWFLVISLTICLGIIAKDANDYLMIAYMSMFSSLVMIGQFQRFSSRTILGNAYLVGGSLGVITLLLALSFRWYWEEVPVITVERPFAQPEVVVSILFTIIAIGLLSRLLKEKTLKELNSKSYVFLIFIVLFFVGSSSATAAQVLINMMILLMAIHTILDGAQQNHLGILNYGLVIISLLICCRFFDTNFSFVIRGLLFIAIGAGFFIANYYMLQKRKKET